jgi:hypothetical protein
MKRFTCIATLVIVTTVLLSSTKLHGAEVLKQKLMGRWELDSQRTHSLGGKSALVVEQYQRGGIRMFLEFRPDKTAITTIISRAGRHSAPTKWKVIEENVRAITVELTDEQTKLTTLGIGEFLNDDVVKMNTMVKGGPNAAPTMIYRRIR